MHVHRYGEVLAYQKEGKGCQKGGQGYQKCDKNYLRYCTGSESNTEDLPLCSKGRYCPRRTAAGKELKCPAG